MLTSFIVATSQACPRFLTAPLLAAKRVDVHPCFRFHCGIARRSCSDGSTSSPPSPSHGCISTSLPSHTLRPGYPMRRAWQPWLSQPCQRVRHKRFPQPRAGSVPTTGNIPLVCAHQRPGFNFPPRPRSWPCQQARKCQQPQGSQVGRPVLMAPPPAGLQR